MFLPGIAALGLPLPLGGSSDHFRTAALREAGGWDPYNVTEDADLGMRLARFGYRTGVIDSTTYEEAPAKWGAWLRQRSRWFKGWMRLVKDLAFVFVFNELRALQRSMEPTSQRCRNNGRFQGHRRLPRRTTMETALVPLPRRTPWNKGKLTSAKPPLRPKHVWAIRTKLQLKGRNAVDRATVRQKKRGGQFGLS